MKMWTPVWIEVNIIQRRHLSWWLGVLARRRLCETRAEKLTAGTGRAPSLQAASLPAKGLGVWVSAVSWGPQGEATGKCGFGAFWGLQNQIISTFHSGFTVFSFWTCAKKFILQSVGVRKPIQHPLNDDPDIMSCKQATDRAVQVFWRHRVWRLATFSQAVSRAWPDCDRSRPALGRRRPHVCMQVIPHHHLQMTNHVLDTTTHNENLLLHLHASRSTSTLPDNVYRRTNAECTLLNSR